ncbi:MAG: tetratricopeptide repeat protein [Candidatus Methanoperedens sp.]|nr:tetratricopeptide repeat protein [Candidatus Methanoperedens sp.]MCZ7406040.1 tetratricopeptide repeat protein [Candidatus Methanoperedens sp.]
MSEKRTLFRRIVGPIVGLLVAFVVFQSSGYTSLSLIVALFVAAVISIGLEWIFVPAYGKWINQADALSENNNNEEAAQLYVKALSWVDDEDEKKAIVEKIVDQANALCQRNKYDEALQIYSQALGLADDTQKLAFKEKMDSAFHLRFQYYNQMFAEKGDAQGAIEWYNKEFKKTTDADKQLVLIKYKRDLLDRFDFQGIVNDKKQMLFYKEGLLDWLDDIKIPKKEKLEHRGNILKWLNRPEEAKKSECQIFKMDRAKIMRPFLIGGYIIGLPISIFTMLAAFNTAVNNLGIFVAMLVTTTIVSYLKLRNNKTIKNKMLVRSISVFIGIIAAAATILLFMIVSLNLFFKGRY